MTFESWWWNDFLTTWCHQTKSILLCWHVTIFRHHLTLLLFPNLTDFYNLPSTNPWILSRGQIFACSSHILPYISTAKCGMNMQTLISLRFLPAWGYVKCSGLWSNDKTSEIKGNLWIARAQEWRPTWHNNDTIHKRNNHMICPPPAEHQEISMDAAS